jgi:lipoteichoic acid synthase
MPAAHRVLLMWGINEWGVAPRALWPAGTYANAGALYTPMERDGGEFRLRFTVPKGTVVDYAFEVVEDGGGHTVTAWEVNGAKPFRAVCAADQVVSVNSRLMASDLGRSSRGRLYRGLAACGAAILALALLLALRASPAWGMRPTVAARMTGSAVVLWISLTAVRLAAIRSVYGVIDVAIVPAAGLYDLLFLTAVTAPFAAAARWSRSETAWRVLYGAWAACAVAVLALGIVNEQIIEILGRPFDIEWLYYSDFLRGFDWHAALRHGSWGAALAVTLGAGAAVLGCGSVAARIGTWARRRWRWAPAAALGTCAFFIAFATAGERRIDYALVANPEVFFARSMWGLHVHPKFFEMAVPAGYAEEFERRPDHAAGFTTTAARPHNVVLLILESTPAELVDPFGARYGATPELARYAGQAALFPNFYSHIPSSIKSMVCMMSSMYPWISYRALCREHPDAPVTALSDEFRRRGAGTLFLSSGNFQFGKAAQFLEHHHFDQITDVNSLTCEGRHFEDDLSQGMATDGRPDGCMPGAFARWLDAQRGRPFFAAMWTYQTHYPYYVTRPETNYGAPTPDLNRYLNALHDSDAAVGAVMRSLEERGLADDTLVVAVGDHGETFGRHGRHGHASAIYDDQVHVPLMLINRKLFAGERRETPGAHVDLGPTIFDVLGWDMPADWQGTSMFAPGRSPRVYFFTPFADLRFGIREGNRTALFAPAAGEAEVFDLARDPAQMANRAAENREFLEAAKLRMAAWVQHQNRWTDRLFTQK